MTSKRFDKIIEREIGEPIAQVRRTPLAVRRQRLEIETGSPFMCPLFAGIQDDSTAGFLKAHKKLHSILRD